MLEAISSSALLSCGISALAALMVQTAKGKQWKCLE